MAAIVEDVTVEQGATYTLRLQWTDAVGVPIPLTGLLGRGMVRLKSSDTAPLATLQVSIISEAEGKFDVIWPATCLEGVVLAGKSYKDKTEAWYDAELYDPLDTSIVYRMVNGRCLISPEITKV